MELPNVEIEMRQWSAETEVEDLQRGDIGLVPVSRTRWNEWKFFYKTIQYMAVGIPVVAYKIGSNKEIIQNGVNGFLVEDENEWYEKLNLLLENPKLRMAMGREARKTVVENFSLESQIPKVINVFEQTDKNKIQKT